MTHTNCAMISGKSFDEIYASLIGLCNQYGIHSYPRNKPCYELRPCLFTIDDARYGLYTGLSRRLNYRFVAIETMQYIAGWGSEKIHADLLVKVNSQIEFVRNPLTGLFDGAYGPRLRNGLKAVYKILKKDPDSRQAYAPIWGQDVERDSKDVPCTIGMHFLTTPTQFSDGNQLQLDLVLTMRSNDLNWGTPYDVAAFCAIQSAMADSLGLSPGCYHHLAGSLHIYEENASGPEKPPKVKPAFTEQFIKDVYFPRWPMDWETLRDYAHVWLCECYQHLLVDKHRPTSFQSDLEKSSTEFSHYWKWWSNLIRFSWKEFDAGNQTFLQSIA